MSFIPTPKQKEALELLTKKNSSNVLLFGGSRCISGDTVLDGCVKTIEQQAREKKQIVVQTAFGPASASAPWCSGQGSMYEVTTESGKITVSEGHRFWTLDGWKKLKNLAAGDKIGRVTSLAHGQRLEFSPDRLPSNLALVPSACRLDAFRLTRTGADSQSSCCTGRRQCGVRLPRPSVAGQANPASSSDVAKHSRESCSCPSVESGSREVRQHQPEEGCSQTCRLFLESCRETCASLSAPQFPGEDRAYELFRERFLSALESPGTTYPLSAALQSAAGHRGTAASCCSSENSSNATVQLPPTCSQVLGQSPSPSVLRHEEPSPVPSHRRISLDTSISFEPIVSIKRTAIQQYYTLEVYGIHHYTVNSFLNHNSGKTLLFLYAMIVRALKEKNSRHAVVRNIFRDCKQKVGMVSLPEVFKLIGVQPDVDKSNWIFTLPTGSEIWLTGLDDAGERDQRILGSEYSTILFEEANEIPYASTIPACTRLAQRNSLSKRAWYSCNPPSRASWLHKLFVEGVNPIDALPMKNFSEYACLRMNPSDNKDHIDPDYIKRLQNLPERQRLRFLDGEWGAVGEGALWKKEWIENGRMSHIVEELVEVVVGVDPACGGSCETGIVAVGRGESGNIYVLSDRTSRGTPAEWSQIAVALRKEVGAKKIIVESNQGGNMVSEIFRHADPAADVELIHASASKQVRAEPVAALAERGWLHHVGEFLELEDQLVTWLPGTTSPDRLDAMVHAVAYLTQKGVGTSPSLASSNPVPELDDKLWETL